MSSNIDSSKQKIIDARSKLSKITLPDPDMAQLIDQTNLLRNNEFLNKKVNAQSDLITSYDDYTCLLESTLLSMLEIQKELLKLKKQTSKKSKPKAKK